MYENVNYSIKFVVSKCIDNV